MKGFHFYNPSVVTSLDLYERSQNAMKGIATHVINAQLFLQRKDYLEECYFTWSMTPVFDDNHTVAGIYSESCLLGQVARQGLASIHRL